MAVLRKVCAKLRGLEHTIRRAFSPYATRCQIRNLSSTAWPIPPNLSLHYITNSPGGDVTLFNPSKPTVLLSHAVALDTSWLRAQFNDPRLNNSYNMIAFDQRNAGKTRSPYTAYRDSYVDAADLAFAFELLQLPPVHVFAVQVNSVWTALRFSLLFPSNVLSLCLASIPADVPPDWTFKAFKEILEIWCCPPDLETAEKAALEMSYFEWSGQIPPELEDEVIAWWQMNLPPRAVIEGMFSRTPPTKEEYARIKVPTLLMTGDKSPANPVEEAFKTHESILGSQFFVVKGAPEHFVMLPQYSSIANRVACEFLRRQPPPPKFVSGKPNLEKMAREALQRLAQISGNPSVASRAPTSPLSFSMWSPESLAQNQAWLDQMEADERKAFSPLDAEGRPIRKFSSRHDDQWASAGFDLLHSSVQAVKGIRIKKTS